MVQGWARRAACYPLKGTDRWAGVRNTMHPVPTRAGVRPCPQRSTVHRGVVYSAGGGGGACIHDRFPAGRASARLLSIPPGRSWQGMPIWPPMSMCRAEPPRSPSENTLQQGSNPSPYAIPGPSGSVSARPICLVFVDPLSPTHSMCAHV